MRYRVNNGRLRFDRLSKDDIDRLGKAFWGIPYEQLDANHLNALKALDWNYMLGLRKQRQLFDLTNIKGKFI